MDIRLVFMGTPEFALPTLRGLTQNYTIVGVVTQPDRPSGRGRTMTPPPVKILAQELDIPFIQPARLREPEAIEQLRRWKPDLIVVAAYGQILRPEVLDLPPHGCINVHASLLPRWRGAAPIQAAILAGDEQSGVTIMLMDPGMDTGPILNQRSTPILPEDTGGSLSQRIAVLGTELLLKTIPAYMNGEILPTPQDDSLATYAPVLKKEDGELDFSLTAAELVRQVRAFNPWPGTYTTWKGQVLKIHLATTVEGHLPPATHTVYRGLPAIGTAEGLLVLEELQPAGKKPMSGKVFLQGARNWT